MKSTSFLLAVAAGLGFAVSAIFSTFGASEPTSLHTLAENAVSSDATVASSAIARLRAKGPDGLDALLKEHAALVQQHDANPNALLPEQQAAWQRLEHALDSVSAQRDCAASRLFWYTNLDDAKWAAQASGKPILSLRLLGNLDEEYSCANSRYFRTTLYANAEVSQYLRDHFILHWKSVRPVPRITVDFGNGRKIERTITGNSIHYILDSYGNPVDALPGLYGAKAFLKGLADAEAAASQSGTLAEHEREEEMRLMTFCAAQPASVLHDERNQFLREYHSRRLAAIQQAWRNDMLALAGQGTAGKDHFAASSRNQPAALNAAPIATSKSRIETPLLKSFQSVDDATWQRIARLHANEATLDYNSIQLISSKNPTATEAGRVAITKSVTENPLTGMLRNLQRSIAEDTVRNEYLLHTQIHQWFLDGTAPNNVDQLNQLVYARLFLTPDSDPWLGLVPENTFTGLENNGLAQASTGH